MTRILPKIFVAVLLSFACFVCNLEAQVISARIGVNGLTCSQCSRSVEMQLRGIGFVQSVDMNLQETEANVTFKPQTKLSFDQLAKAVKDAGFSTRFLSVKVNLDRISISDDVCLPIDNYVFQITNPGKEKPAGIKSFTLLGKSYGTEDSKSRVNSCVGLGKIYRVKIN